MVIGFLLAAAACAPSVFDRDQRSVLQTVQTGSADRAIDKEFLDVSAGVRSVLYLHRVHHGGLLEFGEPDRWAGWAGHRADDHRLGRDDGADLCFESCKLLSISRFGALGELAGTDDLLRIDGRREPRFSVVQLPSRAGVHGRRGIAGSGRRTGHRRGADQAGDSAGVHRRSLCDRSAVGDFASGEL